MESVKGETRGSFSYWWYSKESATFFRFLLLWIITVAVMTYGAYAHITNSTSVSRNDFSTVEKNLYIPNSRITNGTVHYSESTTTRVELKSRQEFEKVDRKNPIIYAIETEKNSFGGLRIKHIVKLTNESTQLYLYTESVPAYKHNFWYDIKPTSISFDGKAVVNWEYSVDYFQYIVAVVFIASFVLAIIETIYWEKLINKKWAKIIAG